MNRGVNALNAVRVAWLREGLKEEDLTLTVPFAVFIECLEELHYGYIPFEDQARFTALRSMPTPFSSTVHPEDRPVATTRQVIINKNDVFRDVKILNMTVRCDPSTIPWDF